MTGQAVPETHASATADVFRSDLARKLIPFAIFGAAVYLVLFFVADASQTADQLNKMAVGPVLLALGLSAASFAVRFLRWQHYLSVVDLSVPWRPSLVIFLVGFIGAITPGKIGEIIKPLLLKEAFAQPVARSAPLVVAERITDVIGLLILGGASLLLLSERVLTGLVVFAAAAALVAVCASARLGTLSIEWLCRIPLLARRRDKLLTAHRSLTALSSARVLATALPLSCAAWGIQSLCVWIFATAIPDTAITVPEAMLAFGAPLLAGALALVPGGLGATEASMAGILFALGGTGMTRSVGVAITVLVRLTSFWLALVLGMVALLLWRRWRTTNRPR